MAATTSPFAVLPILAYAFASLLLVYLGLRLVRYLKSRQASALPKPVSGASSKNKTLLGGARSTASSWRQWSQSLPLPALPQVRVPWVRIPSLSESSIDDIGTTSSSTAPAKTKNGKNLAIELLPTTGLPPPPSSAPIFSPTPTRTSTPGPQLQQNQIQHQQLIDISSPPATPGLTAASTAASGSSFPGSPRTPSPPHIAPHGHGYPPKAVFTPHPTVHAPAAKTIHSPPYNSRAPSPHALLATTSPVKQKRSRSLGGVPVRRLSSGAGSSLRNAVDLEDGTVEMSLLGGKALRGKGEEQLLIDFSSSWSGSGEASDELDDPFVSPAASDIGVLSLNSTGQPPSSSVYTAYASSGPYAHSGYKVAPSVVSAAATASVMATTAMPLRVDARQVGRHVPLVDLSDSDTPTSNFDEDGWKWFGAGTGTSQTKSTAAVASAGVVTKAPMVVGKAVMGENERLVDIDDDVHEASGPAPAAQVQTFAAPSAAMREEPHVRVVNEDTSEKDMLLVDLEAADEKEGVLVDVGFDEEDEERWARQAYPSQAIQFKDQGRFDTTENDNAYSNEPLHDDHRNDIHEPIDDAVRDATPENTVEDALIHSPSPVVPAASSTSILQSEPIADAHTPASGSTQFQTAPAPTNASWAWDDPWNGHLVSPEPNQVDFVQSEDLIELELENRGGVMAEEEEEEKARPAESDDHVSDVQEAREEVVEKSPAGLLKATVLEEDDDNESVPTLDLESLDLDAFVPFETPKELGAGEHDASSQSVSPNANNEEAQGLEDEEEITPTPTPASSHAELSPSALPEVMLVDVEAQQALDDPTEVFYPDPELMQLNDIWTSPDIDSALHEKEVVVLQEEELFPDPDLLPLPLASKMDAETVDDSLDAVRSQLLAIADKGRPSTPTLSQTPTPPASPPPLHPISTTSALLRPAKSRGASRVPSPTGTVSVNSGIAFPVGAVGDKENAVLTPTTVYAQQQRPAWSLRAADAPALGLPSSGGSMGASPRGRRKALEDVNWDVAEEKQEVAVVEQKTEKVEALLAKVPEELRDEEQKDETRQGEKTEEEEQATPVEDAELAAPRLEPPTSLPGAFPEPSPPAIVISAPAISSSTSTVSFPSASSAANKPASKDSAPSSPTTSTTPTSVTTSTVAQRLRRASLTARTAWTMPSTRTLVRSPLDIALAMQMRPGLGAGADPAWMVRFLMAVYGWLLVSVAGGDF